MDDFSMIKIKDKVPKHITFQQVRELDEKIDDYYKETKMPNKRNKFLAERDKLLFKILFQTGGRVGDVVKIKDTDIDYTKKTLYIKMQKTKKELHLHLDDGLLSLISRFVAVNHIKGKLFPLTTSAVWLICKKHGKLLGIDLHPHMFRHGLALHMLNSNVPLKLIQHRLGHRSIKTTAETYLVITPEVEKQMLNSSGVKWE